MKNVNTVVVLFLIFCMVSYSAGEDRIPLTFSSTNATSTLNNQLSDFAVDGVTSNDSRWVSENVNSQHRLTLEFGQQRTIEFIKVVMGWSNSASVWTSPISNFHFEYRNQSGVWFDLPGSFVANNTRSVVTISLDRSLATEALRLVSDDDGYVRVAEVYAFDDSPGELPIVTLERPEILVNQSGYDVERTKRFTTPAIDASPFEIVRDSDQTVVWSGNIVDNIGDFSDFKPSEEGEQYFIRVSSYLRSDRFQIEPYWIERVCFEPAFRFFVDCRSVIGDVPSAYGADPYRDGPYYCFDVQSLILNYLANPSYYERMPIEIDYEAQRAMVLDPGFQLVSNQNAEDSVEVARAYYNDFDPPVGDTVPDIIHCIHWTMAFLQIKTQDWDYAGDPAGRQLHTQHVEKFAFFLYAYPYFQQYITQSYYDDALQFAIDHWDGEGGNLFEVIPTDIQNAEVVTSTFKGRSCPGHSILPNLMMYEVALREGLPNAEDYFDAAFNQTLYIIGNFSPGNVRLTKGQRMSEHMLPTGLFAFLRMYPDRAPAGLQQWIDNWVNVMIARSDNLYDFRRFGFFEGQDLWTIPRFGDESSNGGSGWNEPGNVACVPGILTAMGSQASDQSLRPRLNEIATAHYDALFGRNPTGWHSAFNGPTDFVGVERGWQRDFNPLAAARLHGVRGTLNSVATHEHYPDQLDSGFLRHPEGWVAFNAAFNVSLAMQSWDRTELELFQTANTIQFVLRAPIFRPTASVRVQSSSGDIEIVNLNANNSLGTLYSGSIGTTFKSNPVSHDGELSIIGGNVTAEYGGGFFGNRVVGALSPGSAQVQVGDLLAGSFAELDLPDDQSLTIQSVNAETGNTQIQIQLTTTLPELASRLVGIDLEVLASANTAGLVRELEIFNYQTNAFESLGSMVESVGTKQAEILTLDQNPENFIGSKNEVITRLNWRADGPVLFSPWKVDVDFHTIRLRD